MTPDRVKSFENSIVVILVKKSNLYDLPVKSKNFAHIVLWGVFGRLRNFYHL